jgi:two-component system nitrogen regulation response regulator GlnG
MSRVLVVDDEASISWAFREFLGDLGHEVEVAASAEEGLRIAGTGALDAVVLDVRLPGMDGLTALGRFREVVSPAPVVVITAFGSLDTAVRAMEGGAFDYLVKPFDLDQAAAVIDRALESGRSRQAVDAAGQGGSPAPVPAVPPSPALMGGSPAMQELFKQIALVAPTDVPVLITGESGTGKELVARAIHRHSNRKHGPMLPICLAALSPGLVEGELFGHVRGAFTGATQDRKGLLELADGGTVLLDEVGDVPPALQVKLLRAIEHREVTPVGDARPRPIDVRFLAATNRPLGELMASGQFREDLFFRLSVFPIRVPPLRDRPEDIPALAAHFLGEFGDRAGGPVTLRADLVRELMARPWTGNVRELRNAIERAAIVARCRDIRPEHLPPPAIGTRHPQDGEREGLSDRVARWVEDALASAEPMTNEGSSGLHDQFLSLVEPPLLRAVLRRNQGNRAMAARQLGIHRATLRQKLRRYRLG